MVKTKPKNHLKLGLEKLQDSSRCMILAGEASGDIHGGNLASELRVKFGNNLCMFGFGGPHMRRAGVQILHDIKELAIIGFIEVLKNYWRLRGFLQEIELIFKKNPPDFIVLIDYPGFNVRIARMAKKYGVPVFYYICPQVWAWNPGRIHEIVKTVDKVIAVFPFEVEIWRKAGGNVDYFGHPILEVITNQKDEGSLREHYRILPGERVLSILPGSREQEILNILPTMLQAIEMLQEEVPKLKVFLPLAASINRKLIEPMVRKSTAKIEILNNSTYKILSCSDLAIVASGTATLETAILSRPMVIVYKTTFLTWLISRFVLTLSHIGLPNILAGKKIVPEYIQGEFTRKNLFNEAYRILMDENYAKTMTLELLKIREKLGETGASARVAESIYRHMVEMKGHPENPKNSKQTLRRLA